jgi:hypothetical protein
MPTWLPLTRGYSIQCFDAKRNRENCYAHPAPHPRFDDRMKTIITLALLACAAFISACSHHEEAATSSGYSTTSSSTHGYSK